MWKGDRKAFYVERNAYAKTLLKERPWYIDSLDLMQRLWLEEKKKKIV